MGYADSRGLELVVRGYEEVEGGLCVAHIKDASLVCRLEGNVTEYACVVCGRLGDPERDASFAVLLEELLDVVVETLHHFYADADAVLPWDSEDHELVGPQIDTWEAIDDIAGDAFEDEHSDQIIELINAAIGNEVSWTTWFTSADPDDLNYAWSQFAQIAKYESRMVVGLGSPTDPPARLARFLRSVLLYVHTDLGLVKTVDPGTAFYRGRLCEEPGSLKRHSDDLGPAPLGKATANRMSPAGVALLYASGDPQTAIAEIAGHGIEPFAVIGEFTNTRALRVLDLAGKPSRVSPFDLEMREAARMGEFLSDFVQNITVPVIPDDRQHVEYAPTQLMTEFLRWVPEPRLDGIALPSTQSGERTFVLFFGPADCSTLGAPLTDPKPTMRLANEDPTFTLDPETVLTYRVERRYLGVEAGHVYRAAAPWKITDE